MRRKKLCANRAWLVNLSALLLATAAAGPLVAEGADFSPPVTVEGAELRPLAAGTGIFAAPHDNFLWEGPVGPVAVPGLDTFIAVTELNRTEPLTVALPESGYLYAVPWRWDFGFLDHLGDRDDFGLRIGDTYRANYRLHGWQRVRHVSGQVRNMPPPFSPLPVYRRPLSAGTHAVDVGEYWGQWVLIGFQADAEAAGGTELPTVALSPATTGHNVVGPGVQVSIEADQPIQSARLYHHAVLFKGIEGNTFTSPTQAGRYVLAVEFAAGIRLVPLTVGLPRPTVAGWRPEEFFPILSYTGAEYAPGYDLPNPAVAVELTILNQFELGYNTWFTQPEQPGQKELIAALGGRQLPIVSGVIRWPMRDIEDDDQALYHIFYHIDRHGPYAENVLGIYVEDEPPIARAPRMALVEERFAEKYGDTDLHLIYCAYGDCRETETSFAYKYWRTAQTPTGMFRAYPFYESLFGGDIEGIRARTRAVLTCCIDHWRKLSPDGPLWVLLPNFSDKPVWYAPTPAQLRLVANLTLARGVQAIGYFGWANSMHANQYRFLGNADWPYVPTDGRYEVIGEINAKIAAMELQRYRWLAEVEQPTDDFDVQLLADDGGRLIAWVTNWSWLETVTGTVVLPDRDEPVQVVLAPGDSVVIDCGYASGQ